MASLHDLNLKVVSAKNDGEGSTRTRRCGSVATGDMIMVREADDFTIGFEHIGQRRCAAQYG
jgi:hypothetical protein